MVNEKTELSYIWTYLASLGKHNVIELLGKAARKEIQEININKRIVPDLIVHNTIVKFLEQNGVKVNRMDIKIDHRGD